MGRPIATYTTISVLRTTKQRLVEMCRKDETYDDLLRRLLDEVGSHRDGRVQRR